MSDQHNFVLCGRNSAKLATLTAHDDTNGGEAENLVNYTRPELPWVSASTGPHATSILARYPSEVATRALCLSGGRLPVHGSQVRVCRGTSLEPMLVARNATTASTNVTGSLDRTIDPRDAVDPTYVTAATPGSDWSITMDFADPEFGWSDDKDQLLVVVAHSSVSDGDCSMKVECKDSGGAFQELATVTVRKAVGETPTPRFSWRLDATQISDPPEVRVTGGFVSTGDLRMHGVAFFGPVDPANDVLRLDGDLLASVNTSGGAGETRTNPIDTRSVQFRAAVIEAGSTGDGFRGALETDTRSITAATLKFAWQLETATSTTVTVKLFHDGAEIATIDTYTTATTTVVNESTSIPLGSLPDDDGVGLELEFTRTSGTSAVRIGGVAIYPTYSTAAEIRAYDSGWSGIANGASPYITGGLAVDNVGRPVDITIARDFRDGNNDSIEVLAPDTFIDLDITRDPTDADTVLTAANQSSREITFRHLFEGPGLANMRLQKRASIEFVDGSQIDETLGGFPVTVARRIYRTIAFELGLLPADIGPEEVGSLLYRVGQTEPLLLVVLPTVPAVSNLFSLFGLVARDPTVSHALSTALDSKIRMREY